MTDPRYWMISYWLMPAYQRYVTSLLALNGVTWVTDVCDGGARSPGSGAKRLIYKDLAGTLPPEHTFARPFIEL